MLQTRVIPCLLLQRGGLVKTIKFKKPCYIGDPINAVKIFSEKEVDELMLLDIDATKQGREPDYGTIESIVSEAFMPICYGGGIRKVKHMQRLFNLGIEKVAISSSAIEDPDLVTEGAARYGSQSIVVVLDVKRKGLRRRLSLVTHNGKKETGLNPFDAAIKMEKLGAGELVVNNVDRDGVMKGYDLEIVKKISESVMIPVIALGGAGTLHDLKDIVHHAGASAAAAGSLFVYKGPLKGVLINYPAYSEMRQLFGEELE